MGQVPIGPRMKGARLMEYDPDFEKSALISCLPLIGRIICPLRFMPRDDLRSIASLSALCAIRSGDIDGKTLEERIQERIIEDLAEEKHRLREQGWSRFNTFSLDRFVSGDRGATLLDWVPSPKRTEHIVLALEFERSLSAEEREAAECLAFDCPLRDMEIRGRQEVSIRNRIRKKWLDVFRERET